MPARQPTFASPEEERAYLAQVKDELESCQTKDDVIQLWRKHFLKIGHRKLGRLLLGRPLDEVSRSK